MKPNAEMRFSKIEKTLLWCSLAAFAFYALTSIYFFKGLYADGAFFFIDSATRISEGRADWWSDDAKHIRLFASIVSQLPLKFALDAGVTDIEKLRWFYNAPLFLMNGFLLAWTFVLSKRANEYLLFVASMAVYVLFIVPSDIFAANPARISMGVYWLIFTYLLLPIRLRWFDRLALIALAVFIFRSHEGIILCGPFLLLAGALQWFRRYPNRAFRLGLGLIGFAGTIFGLYWQMSHPVGTQTANYLSIILNLTPRDFSRTMFGFVWLPTILIFLFGFAYKNSSRIRARGKGFWIPLSVLIVFGTLPFFFFKFIQPGKEFNLRFLITAGGPGLMIVLLFLFWRRFESRVQLSSILLILALTHVGEVVWQTASLRQWNRMVSATNEVVSRSSAPLVTREAVLAKIEGPDPKVAFRYEWSWVWPMFGLAFADQRDVATLIEPADLKELFKIKFDGPEVAELPFMTLREGLFRFAELKTRCAQSPAECGMN